ncbi:hypothetical protein C0584_05100 [Candidatus Parcubacteria bacterium]|nr:MAG: hypothetical protein C0584_05100 [Candidatus Parcubacteria bacterium]
MCDIFFANPYKLGYNYIITNTKIMAKKTKISPKLIKYLEEAGINHEILEHRTVYTALDAAATMKKKINEIAKSLLVKADKDYYILVLPADNNLDLNKVSKTIEKNTGEKVKSVKIPGEKIMETVFKIKSGAMSSFGNMHKIPVIVDNNLAKLKKAIFSSGSFNHSVEVATKDFIKLEEALLGSFGVKKKIKKPKTAPKKKKTPKKKVSAKKAVKKASPKKSPVKKGPAKKKK